MKDKTRKKLIICLELFIILFLVSLISSKYLSYFEKKPIIIFKTTVYEYNDGSVTEYLSLLHKVIKYDRKSMNKWEVTSIFKDHNNGEGDFTIIYYSDECRDINEEIYKDNKYIYYLPCYDSNTIKIKFESNEEISLKEAINSKKVTINDLIKKRLFLEKIPITNN